MKYQKQVSELPDFSISDWLDGRYGSEIKAMGIPPRIDGYRPGIAGGIKNNGMAKDMKRGQAIMNARANKAHVKNVEYFNNTVLPLIIDRLSNQQLFEIYLATESQDALMRSGFRKWEKDGKMAWLEYGDEKEKLAIDMGAVIVLGYVD